MNARLAPSLTKRFRSGRPCLDFAHTAATEHWSEPELIVDRKDLQRWLEHVLGLDAVQAREDDLAAALRLRDAILRLARARAHDRELAADDIRTLNESAAGAPPVLQLTVDGMICRTATTPAAAALSAVARDAVDLLAGPLGHRIRICAAEDCAFLFVDASRPGTRRWCSMQRCGNLNKVRTHRGGRTAGSSAEDDPTRG